MRSFDRAAVPSPGAGNARGDGPWRGWLAWLLEALAEGEGSRATTTPETDGVTVTGPEIRLLRDAGVDPNDAFQAWSGLWEGCLSTHDRFLGIDSRRVADGGVFRITPR